MNDNNIPPAGFKITITSQASRDNFTPGIPLQPSQIGAQIVRFIESQIVPGKNLTLAVRIEHCDEIFHVEDSFYDISPNLEKTSDQDYTRNYWI